MNTKIKIQDILLNEIEAATNGEKAKYRAEIINARIIELKKELKEKQFVKVYGKPYAGKYCIESIGIYYIPGKGSIPVRANLMLYTDGTIMIETNYFRESMAEYM